MKKGIKIGVLSDTHEDDAGAIPHIVQQFKKREVEVVVHCGDIIPEHVLLLKKLLGDIPVFCALVGGQKEDPVFNTDGSPKGWKFTRHEKRFTTLPDGTEVYIGHKRPMDFLRQTEEKFNETLADLRMEQEGLRWVFGGHSHIQTLKQGHMVSLLNPGAVSGAISRSYEYATVDTRNNEVVFCRILPTRDDRETWSLGVLSDSLDVSHRDKTFWLKQADEFDKRDVKDVIICGNLDLNDIGRQEFAGFTVNYAIRSDQKYNHDKLQKEGKIPPNWKLIVNEKDSNPDAGGVVDIRGYRFYVQLDLGLEFMKISELGMDSLATAICRKYPETKFVLCGFTREALFVEGEHVTTINPGDAHKDRSFVVGCFPRNEWTFGHVPVDPLPELTDI